MFAVTGVSFEKLHRNASELLTELHGSRDESGEVCPSVKRQMPNVVRLKQHLNFNQGGQAANACPHCADSLPYIRPGGTHLEINSLGRLHSAHGERTTRLHISSVWTYSFSISLAALHISLLSTF